MTTTMRTTKTTHKSTLKSTASRRTLVQIVAAALLVTACGGDDATSSNDPEPSASNEDAGAPAGDENTDSDDAQSAEPTDESESESTAEPDDAPEPPEQGGDGGSVDGSGVDWATVDLTTIDWANIDLDDIDFAATEDNPTVTDLSEADLAIIQERMAARFGSGAATLTIGDRTFEFEGFQCAFESSGVLNEGTTLGTNLFDEVDGARIQMQIDVYDDGTAQFTMDDIDDFDNPSVSYLETTDITVTVDGETVRAEGDVTDQTSDTSDVVPMTFEGECGPGSIR